jgi:hypothetical protein
MTNLKVEYFGDRQNMFYLPRGFLGLIVMSYFGKVADRSTPAVRLPTAQGHQ